MKSNIENMNANLSVSSELYKGSDIYKGIYRDDLHKGFSEKPEKKDKDEKPQPPTIEETHADEQKAKELKQEHSAKMDRKHSYKGMERSEQKAIRVLLNIESKSAKEKIEAIMEHFSVSKLGAINILAECSCFSSLAFCSSA